MRSLASRIADLRRDLQAATEHVDVGWRELVELYVEIDDLRRDAAAVCAELADRIGAAMTSDEARGTVVDGVGLVVRHARRDRVRWDVDDLAVTVAARLAAQIADDPDVVLADVTTGEVNPAPEVARRAVVRAVHRMVDLCAMTPSASWRTTALRGLGIDPADYRSGERAGWTVRVERGIGTMAGDTGGGTDDSRRDRTGRAGTATADEGPVGAAGDDGTAARTIRSDPGAHPQRAGSRIGNARRAADRA